MNLLATLFRRNTYMLFQVTNFFAVSSRYGTPEDFKQLVDEAHGNLLQLIQYGRIYVLSPSSSICSLNIFPWIELSDSKAVLSF